MPGYDARGNQPRMTGGTTGARIRVLRRATSTAGRHVGHCNAWDENQEWRRDVHCHINTAFVLSHIGPAALDQAPQRGSIIAEVPLTVSSTEAGDSRSPTVTVYVPAPTHRTPLSST